jgi:hypothetical protein
MNLFKTQQDHLLAHKHKVIISIGLVAALSFIPTANAAFIQNSFGLSNPHTTINFEEHVFPSWTIITDQYADLGIEFAPFAVYDPYPGGGNVSNFYPSRVSH